MYSLNLKRLSVSGVSDFLEQETKKTRMARQKRRVSCVITDGFVLLAKCELNTQRWITKLL